MNVFSLVRLFYKLDFIHVSAVDRASFERLRIISVPNFI